MKIFLIVILSVFMFVLLVSCGQTIELGSDESAFDAWYIMNENIMDADSFEFSFVELMVLFVGEGDPIEIENTGTISKEVLEDGCVNMHLSISLSTGGETNEVEVYYYNEFMFFYFEGSKHKRKSDLDIALRIMYAQMPDLTSIPIITDGIGEGSRPGYKEINFALYREAEFFEFIKDALIDSFRLRNAAPNSPEVAIEIFGPVAFVVEIGNDYSFISYTLAFTADITVGEEEEFRAYYEISKTAERIGAVIVSIPQNIHEYIDITM